MQLAVRDVFEGREARERNCIVTITGLPLSWPQAIGSQDAFGSFYDSLTRMDT